jgi:hypothetical protein
VSKLHAANRRQRVEFDLWIEPQQQGFSNWGWPVVPEPAGHQAAVLLRQYLEQHNKHRQQ